MSKSTKIEWTDDTVNPTLGCNGCELWSATTGVQLCYAGIFTGRLGPFNSGLADDFNVVSTAPGRMVEAARWSDLSGKPRPKKPWLDGLPRLIFVGDMADSFSREISYEYLRDEVIAAVSSQAGQRHQWQWLTKRPQRMAEFSRWLSEEGISWPSNLWVGTSLTTQATASRLEPLIQVGDSDTIRFASVEPQWEAIDLTDFLPALDWVIQGGLSGTDTHPFALEWADELRLQCREHHVAYFLKQLGTAVQENGEVRCRRDKQSDWLEWPKRLRVRQMPISARPARKLLKQKQL